MAADIPGRMMLSVVLLQLMLMFCVMTQEDVSEKVETVNVASGDPATLLCQGPPSIPTGGSVSWFKVTKDVPSQLQDNERMFTNHHSTGRLYFSFVQTSDSGLYRCGISRGQYIQLGTPVNMVVSQNAGQDQIPPYLMWKSADTDVLLGGETELECVFAGKPSPVVTWQHNGKHTGQGRQLRLENVSLQDSGEYTCVGKNTAGKHSETIPLHVLDTSATSPVATAHVDSIGDKDDENTESTSEGTVLEHGDHGRKSTNKSATASGISSNTLVVALVPVVVLLVIVGVVVWKRRQLARDRNMARSGEEHNADLVLGAKAE